MTTTTPFKTKKIKDYWYCYGTYAGHDYTFGSDNEFDAVELAKTRLREMFPGGTYILPDLANKLTISITNYHTKPTEFLALVDIPAVTDEFAAIMREADKVFETTGGGTRHYVRDVLVPLMQEKGFCFCRIKPKEPVVEKNLWEQLNSQA